MEREIQEKEGLLQDIEQPVSLKLMPLSYHKEDDVLKNLTFELVQGERVFLHGENGCGKSTLIKTILQQVNIGQAGYERKNVQQINTQQLCKIACDRRRNPNSFNACRGTVKL